MPFQTMDTSNQMRIHVNADGVVEFSVELTNAVDPSLVATVVAAVRRGIFTPLTTKNAATTQTSSSPQPSSLPLPPILPSESNPEPTSDPDSTAIHPTSNHHHHHQNCNCLHKSSSPSLYTASRNRSVRQIAAEIDSRPQIQKKQQLSYSQYDNHREFSSSPTMWITTRDEFVDANGTIAHHSAQKLRHHNQQHHQCNLSHHQRIHQQVQNDIENSLDDDDEQQQRDRQSQQPTQRQSSLRIKSVKSHPHSMARNNSDRHENDNSYPIHLTSRQRSNSTRTRGRKERRESDLALMHQEMSGSLVQHPIRMFSLPHKTRYEAVNDIYFGQGDRNSNDMKDQVEDHRGVFEPSEHQPLNHLTHLENLDIHSDLTNTFNQRRSTGAMDEGHLVERVQKRREVSVPVLGNEFESDLHSHLFPSGFSHHDPNSHYDDDDHDQEREHAPLAPYMIHRHRDDELKTDGNWDDVEYEVTTPYRTEPNNSEMDSHEQDEKDQKPTGRSAAWKLFASIGTTFSRRKPELVDYDNQSTLASGGVLHKSGLSAPGGRMNQRKGRSNMFSRSNRRSGAVWLEFTSQVSSEGLIGEIGTISKNMGYQVWRRAGEQKLRCIRQLSQRIEIHVVIMLSMTRTAEGQATHVVIRRARSDRNRTESWRYSIFYRELIERLERIGIEAETPDD